MIAADLPTAISRLGNLFENASVIVPFTGAGISTECGIPDFRSPGGLWTKNQPIPFDAFVASQDMRDEAWRRRFAMEESFAKARPGRGHQALASFYRAGKSPALITQNIDNLHQSSGIAASDVVELHGNTTYAVCLDCARRYELSWIREKFEAPAGATSKPRLFRSGRRCHLTRCNEPRNWPGAATFFWQLVPRWSCGRRRVSR
jgi:NAD-dependent deacetylase